MTTPFHEKLSAYIDSFVHGVYAVSRAFPKEEIYGATSQIRRASLSVALNYTEGFARIRKNVNRNFLEIAYGSLKETSYLLRFAKDEHWINSDDYERLQRLANEIGAMLWSSIERLNSNN